jgi:uncharacterized protein (TIGR02246 family)
MSDAEIGAVLTELRTAWQARDADAYLALLSDEVEVVNRGGQRLIGKAAFAQQLNWLLNKGFPEIFTAEHTVESIRELNPGVAVARELRAESNRQSVASYVLVAREGRWLVESISIVPIAAPAAA